MSNLRPAPFAITPSIVRRVLEVSGTAKSVTYVPVKAEKLVDQPRKSANPANAYHESTQSPQAANEGGREEPARVASAQATPPAPVEAKGPDRAGNAQLSIADLIRKLGAETDRESQRAEPVAKSAPSTRSLGAPSPRKALPAMPMAFEERRRKLEAAIAFLKRKCILVDPLDKLAAVRRYRVSGKRDAMLAEEVIEHAQSMGFEVSDA